jgi:hypothetical protein
MQINIEAAVADLRSKGYHQAELITDAAELASLEEQLKALKQTHYYEQNLERHAVYLSDKTETRESHAMMISREVSDLPFVTHFGGLVEKLLEFHDSVVGAIVGKKYPGTARSMLNFQEYHAGSKPVAEHYDGEYLKYEKLSPTEFKLKEGLLPRYVMVFTVRNENVGEEHEGTFLRDANTGEEVKPTSRPGQVLIFDNIRFRHSVPELKKPRLMCGLRSFDFEPAYFTTGEHVPEGMLKNYTELEDKNNPGLYQMISTKDATGIQQEYLASEWPAQWQQTKKEGAVF